MTVMGERSWLGRAWEVASDLLIATALLWSLPLLLGVVTVVVRLVLTLVRHGQP